MITKLPLTIVFRFKLECFVALNLRLSGLILTALLVVSSFGQASGCPKVSVDGPPELPTKEKPEKFVVNIEGKVDGKPQFVWTISTGTIVKGQGTSEILVIRENFGEVLTATV